MGINITVTSSNTAGKQFNNESSGEVPDSSQLTETNPSILSTSEKLRQGKTTEEQLKSTKSPLDNYLSESTNNTVNSSKDTGITQEPINTNLATNDPVKMANAFSASIISHNEALDQNSHGSDTIEVSYGNKRVEVNMETNSLALVKTGDELFSRKVTGIYLRNDDNGRVSGGTIFLDPDPVQEVSTKVSRKETLKGELKDLQHARDNINVDPREKQPLIVYAGELGFTIKGTDINLRLKASTISSLTATGSNGEVGFDSKGRMESRYGDVVKIKVPAINENENPRVDIGPFATENGAILIGTPLPKLSLPIGSLKAKLEGGANLLEFANQVAEPVRVGVTKIDLLITLTNEISAKQSEIDTLQNQIEDFEPQLKPVTINFKVPD